MQQPIETPVARRRPALYQNKLCILFPFTALDWKTEPRQISNLINKLKGYEGVKWSVFTAVKLSINQAGTD